MAARSLLRKLDAEGLIALPSPGVLGQHAFRHRAEVELRIDESPIELALAALLPLQALARARRR